jgi:hypothetical protein
MAASVVADLKASSGIFRPSMYWRGPALAIQLPSLQQVPWVENWPPPDLRTPEYP